MNLQVQLNRHGKLHRLCIVAGVPQDHRVCFVNQEKGRNAEKVEPAGPGGRAIAAPKSLYLARQIGLLWGNMKK